MLQRNTYIADIYFFHKYYLVYLCKPHKVDVIDMHIRFSVTLLRLQTCVKELFQSVFKTLFTVKYDIYIWRW